MTTTSGYSPINWNVVEDEVITHLRNILRLDTRNPPGNEIRAAEYIRDVLQADGISSEIVGPSPDRGSIVARLKGNGSAPPLLLMSHTDVVAVEPEKWTHDPFAADIADDFIYGRGALDMKGMVTMELMTMLLLKRAGVPLKRDVIYMAAADEEVGGHMGAGWVVHNRPELIQAEYALNEGGGSGFEVNGKRYYTVEAAEKGTARFRLRTTGKPGHGSVPHDNNAIVKLAALLSKLDGTQPPVHFTETFRAYITGIASAQPPEVAGLFMAVLEDEKNADAAIEALPLEDMLKWQMRAMIRNTIAPTMLTAGSQINVIPSEAEARLDGRTLPGWTAETYLEELRSIFGQDIDVSFIDPSIPLEADPASPLFEVIKALVEEHDPGATVVPTLLTGGTDAKHVALLGTKVYGFAPQLYIPGARDWSGVHGHDERIHIRALQWGTRVLYDVVARFATNNGDEVV
ncbi:MAG TPA: M20/M25/M40 family metallo-hydrolase [Ktedonobacteraceae bacterium]|nr:M20/M25/M40 family metallo-hydrolase [Ktedonobacteraceae bacterium]